MFSVYGQGKIDSLSPSFPDLDEENKTRHTIPRVSFFFPQIIPSLCPHRSPRMSCSIPSRSNRNTGGIIAQANILCMYPVKSQPANTTNPSLFLLMMPPPLPPLIQNNKRPPFTLMPPAKPTLQPAYRPRPCFLPPFLLLLLLRSSSGIPFASPATPPGADAPFLRGAQVDALAQRAGRRAVHVHGPLRGVVVAPAEEEVSAVGVAAGGGGGGEEGEVGGGAGDGRVRVGWGRWRG
ncbi:hypothetical protein VTK26DRAFT_5860 [Humicola hyalothermophila]